MVVLANLRTHAPNTQGFKVVRYPDENMRVFKTIALTIPEGYKTNVDYSAVSLEDVIIDALPLKHGRAIGVVLFRPNDIRITEAKVVLSLSSLPLPMPPPCCVASCAPFLLFRTLIPHELLLQACADAHPRRC